MPFPYPSVGDTTEEMRRRASLRMAPDPLDAGVLPPGGSPVPPPAELVPVPVVAPAEAPPPALSDLEMLASQEAPLEGAQGPYKPFEVLSPGGRQVLGGRSTTTPGLELPKEVKERMKESGDAQLKAADLMGEAALIDAQSKSQTAAALTDLSANYAQQVKESQDRRREMENVAYQEIATKQKALAYSDVDPNKFWADRGVGAQIGAALAVAMGAYGASLLNGQNYAMQIIDKAIDRDIQAQLEKRKGKKEELAEARMSLSDRRQMAADEQRSILEAKALAWENVKLQGDQLAAGSGNKRAMAEWGTNRAQVLDNIIKSTIDYVNATTARTQSSTEWGVGNRVVADASGRAPLKPMSKEDNARYFAPLNGFIMGDAGTAKEVKQKAALAFEFNDLKNELIPVVSSKRSLVLGTDEYKDRERIVGRMQEIASVAGDMGVLNSSEDVKRSLGLTGSAKSLTDSVKTINNAASGMMNTARTLINTVGVEELPQDVASPRLLTRTNKFPVDVPVRQAKR